MTQTYQIKPKNYVPSLARGLARELKRNGIGATNAFAEELTRRNESNKNKKRKRSLSAIRKRFISAIEGHYGAWVIGFCEEKRYVSAVHIKPTETCHTLCITVLYIKRCGTTIKCIDVALLVDHLIERIYQRSDQDAVAILKRVSEIIINEGSEYRANVEKPVSIYLKDVGMLFGEWDAEEKIYVMKTFIDHDKIRPEQIENSWT